MALYQLTHLGTWYTVIHCCMLLAWLVKHSLVHWYQPCVTEHHVFKCMSCHKANVVITERACWFHDCICVLRPSCSCEIWALCVLWITCDHLCILYIYNIYNKYFIYIPLSCHNEDPLYKNLSEREKNPSHSCLLRQVFFLWVELRVKWEQRINRAVYEHLGKGQQ